MATVPAAHHTGAPTLDWPPCLHACRRRSTHLFPDVAQLVRNGRSALSAFKVARDTYTALGQDSPNISTPWLAHIPLRISEMILVEASVERRNRSPASAKQATAAMTNKTSLSRSISVLRCAWTIYTVKSRLVHPHGWAVALKWRILSRNARF